MRQLFAGYYTIYANEADEKVRSSLFSDATYRR
jgi:hypothetical protein